MITNAMKRFVEDILDKRRIEEDDVNKLQRDILQDGARRNEEIDVLVALDRAVRDACVSWSPWLVATAVDYVVWQSRPTGHVDAAKAQWLVTTLSLGEGPTENAMRIAFETVREAESCDEALVTFTLRHGTTPGRAASGFSRAALVS